MSRATKTRKAKTPTGPKPVQTPTVDVLANDPVDYQEDCGLRGAEAGLRAIQARDLAAEREKPKIRMALISMKGKTEEQFVADVLEAAKEIGILKEDENKNSKS